MSPIEHPVFRRSNSSAENSRSKRPLPDIVNDPASEHDVQEDSSVVASSSALVASPCTKRGMPSATLLHESALIQCPYVAKRAETRECPICGEAIPLRLLGQHYTLENSRVQTILDHIGDLEGFSDPHASTHVPYVYHLHVPPPRSTQSYILTTQKVHPATPRCTVSP